MDVRCQRDAIRLSVVDSVTESIEALCSRRGVRCAVHRKHDAPATPCDACIIGGLVRAADDSRLVMQRVLLQRPAAAAAEAIAVRQISFLYCYLLPRCTHNIIMSTTLPEPSATFLAATLENSSSWHNADHAD